MIFQIFFNFSTFFASFFWFDQMHKRFSLWLDWKHRRHHYSEKDKQKVMQKPKSGSSGIESSRKKHRKAMTKTCKDAKSCNEKALSERDERKRAEMSMNEKTAKACGSEQTKFWRISKHIKSFHFKLRTWLRLVWLSRRTSSQHVRLRVLV